MYNSWHFMNAFLAFIFPQWELCLGYRCNHHCRVRYVGMLLSGNLRHHLKRVLELQFWGTKCLWFTIQKYKFTFCSNFGNWISDVHLHIQYWLLHKSLCPQPKATMIQSADIISMSTSSHYQIQILVTMGSSVVQLFCTVM